MDISLLTFVCGLIFTQIKPRDYCYFKSVCSEGYLIGINLPGRNLPIFEKGGKFLLGNLKHGQVMERRLKKKS